MTRIIVGASGGSIFGLCLLAALGAWSWIGPVGTPPSAYAAALGALIYVVFFWPVAAGVGTVIGALAGWASLFVSPRDLPDY